MMWSAYWLPKADTPRSDWEDGCAYSPSTGWFAVADGASSGIRSREWAFHLTRSFIASGRDGRFDDGLHARSFIEWSGEVARSFDPEAEEFNPFVLPDWIRQSSARRGAFATFCGGRVTRGRWDAVAVGDCCLFHVGVDGLPVRTFPLAPDHDAAAPPMLLSSMHGSDEMLSRHVVEAGGSLAPGDSLYVTSDAFAMWLLTQLHVESTWRALDAIGTDGFGRLCGDLRADERLKNDDVTILRIREVAA